MRRFLITTALEESWNENEPVLFLGEWCRRYCRKDRWSKLDAVVLPYHWDDRNKYENDYYRLRDLHECLLADLAAQLNQIHGVSHSLRYWRVVIGPWLGYFVQILFDRWTSVDRASKQYDLSATTVLTGKDAELVPNDMGEFIGLILADRWNHYIFATLLRQFTSVPCVEKPRPINENASRSGRPISRKQHLKQILLALYSQMARRLGSDSDAFLLATYMPMRDEIRLCRRLGQMPQFWRTVTPEKVEPNFEQRQWTVTGEAHSDFETCVRLLIPRQIPTAYLEGYRRLAKHAGSMPWPRKPKLILTSNSHHSDDLFKLWAADKMEHGTPLVIGQHGGHYGIGRWSFAEDHETTISDRYLSWGWTDSDKPNVEDVGQLKSRSPLGILHSKQPGALMVTCALPRLSYFMYSAIVSRQWLDYFSDQCKFIEDLPLAIRNALTVRVYTTDYGWDQNRRWRDRFPDLQIDEGRSKLETLVNQSRLYISTYNATTYLESFTMDVPTVMYWNPRHWELRDSAEPYFQELTRVGIFHATPESAARHVASIWDDVDKWWRNPELREVLERFKSRYCRLPVDLLDRIEESLRGVTNASSQVVTH